MSLGGGMVVAIGDRFRSNFFNEIGGEVEEWC